MVREGACHLAGLSAPDAVPWDTMWACRAWWALGWLGLFGCGRIGFAELAGDAIDAAPDAAVVPDGLIAWYPMNDLVDEGSASRAVDATGHGHDAKCTPGACPSQAPGRLGGDYVFDGTDDLLEVPGAQELETTTGFTVAAFVNLAAAPDTRACAATKGLGPGQLNSWALCVEPSRAILFYTAAGATPDNLLSTAAVELDGWHHLAIRWDGARKTIWLDAVQVGSDGPVEIGFDGSGLRIGADIDNDVWIAGTKGPLDDLRIYNRALSQSDLMRLAGQ